MLYSWWVYTGYDAKLIPSLSGDIVLFFHANWCSTCRDIEQKILKTWVPKNLTIFKVDFDTATELRKKYLILTQTTFVQIDKNGTQIKKWLGSENIDDIIDNLKIITTDATTVEKLQATWTTMNKKAEWSLDKKIEWNTSKKTLSWRDKPTKKISNLTASQRKILFEGGTEPAFDNAYRNNHEQWIYVDVIDGTPLFSSTDKFDSGTGRPSFTRPIKKINVWYDIDKSEDMERKEVKSKNWKAHLWHVFDDGPQDKWWNRYCINSAALRFVALWDMEKEWYSEYLYLFK